ncbi:MAG: M23 family metallopeptidase, partial [Candidatus Wallbacteria bacterium]|nr:M23 family metallopeptidase [Candidatus Wallbacteria bacterium]
RIVGQMVEKQPRRAKLRYYLAYIYYSASQNTRDEEQKSKLLDKAREEVYRTLDLQMDKSDPENAVWVANAEVLFDRISGDPNRPIPPVHGRVSRPFNGEGGILVASVMGPDRRPLYDIAGKPVVSFGNGIVEDAGMDRNLGFLVRVRYRDANGQPFVVEYGNLADVNGLKPGMSIESNTILGHVAKGQGRDEPTLFLQIQRQGRCYDPAKLLAGTAQKGDTF